MDGLRGCKVAGWRFVAGRNCLLNGCPAGTLLAGRQLGWYFVLQQQKSSFFPWHQLFNPAARNSLAFPTSPSNSQRLQRDFATMSDSKTWRDRSTTWSDVQIDYDLPAFESINTAQAIDLTRMPYDRDCDYHLWAGQFDEIDQSEPDDADEICEMNVRQQSFLPFLRIFPISLRGGS